jgi:O-antigen/teichoic acid export membrane protein
MLRGSSAAVLGCSVLMAAVAGTGGYFLRDALGIRDLDAFWTALALLVLLPLTRVYGGSLRGLGYIVLGQMNTSLRPGLFLTFIVIAFLLFGTLSPESALALHVGAAAATFALVSLCLRRAVPEEAGRAEPAYQLRFWFRSAWPLLLASSMQIVNQHASVLMLGGLADAEQVGLYRVAQRGAMIVHFGLQSVNMALAPTISSFHAQGEMARMQRMVTRSVRAVAVFALPVCIGLILSAPWIVPFVFGSDFAPAAWPLAILCAAQLVNALTGSVGLVLNMTGHERDTAQGVGMAAVLVVVLNAALIPLWGASGAALGTGIALVAWNALLARWVYKRLGINTTAFRRRRRAL